MTKKKSAILVSPTDARSFGYPNMDEESAQTKQIAKEKTTSMESLRRLIFLQIIREFPVLTQNSS